MLSVFGIKWCQKIEIQYWIINSNISPCYGMEPLTVIAKHMTGICDVAELCVCALTNAGFLDDLWTISLTITLHTPLCSLYGDTCLILIHLWLAWLFVAPQSVSFSSASHALPCDIGIATLEMRNTWSWAVNPLGDDSGRNSAAKMCGGFLNGKTGFCADVGKSDRKSLPEPRAMFSLKSASMASVLSSSVLPLSRCFSSVSHPIIWIWVQIHWSCCPV